MAFGFIGSPNAATFRIKASTTDSIQALSALNNYSAILEKTIGSGLTDTIEVFIAADMQSFDQAVGSDVPDWGAAVAIKEKRLIVIKSPKYFAVGKSMEELLGHEITHLALDNAVGGRWLPRWFEEGFCQLISGEWRFEQDLLLTQAIWGSGLIPLIDLESLNGFGGAKAALSYAESYLAVSMLARDLGMDFFPDFFNEYRANGNLYQSFTNTSGYKYLDWTNLWQDMTAHKYRFILFIFDARLFFPLLAVMFILLYLLKLWQVRKKKKEWERLERLWKNDETYPT
jgi:hypothetical protein